VNIFPATESGAVKTVEFKKWLKLQRRIDDLQTLEVCWSRLLLSK
jgi:hypothetical protein